MRILLVCWLGLACSSCYGAASVDLKKYTPECGVIVTHQDDRLSIRWPMSDGEFGRISLNLGPGPLIDEIGIGVGQNGVSNLVLLQQFEPTVFVTVGDRQTPPGIPDSHQWQVFFDNPQKRPHQSYASTLDKQSVNVTSDQRRLLVTIDRLTVGPFSGALQFVFYPDCRLIQCQAIVSTAEDRRAIVYDIAFLGERAGWKELAWIDTEGELQRTKVDESVNDRSIAVRHRTIVAECDSGSVACFPPPHQFFFPRDWTDNLSTVWQGRNHLGLASRYGFGLRNPKDGGGNFVPWFNAPPGTAQRLGAFLLLARGNAEIALREVLRVHSSGPFSRTSWAPDIHDPLAHGDRCGSTGA